MPNARDEGIRVLIVEDDEDSAEALAFALQRAGYRTATASSSVGALCALRGPERPAVMLLDLNLADLGGPALVDVFKTEGNLPPIVLISAAPPHVIRAAAEALHALAALRKPFPVQALLDALPAARTTPGPPRPGARPG